MRKFGKTTKFDSGVDSMRGAYPRIDFAIESITPSLLAKPETFPSIIGKDISVAKLLAFDGIPDATIYFRFDDATVMLLSIGLN